MTLNSAGRFWFGYVIALVLFALSLPASAGYYATASSVTPGAPYCAITSGQSTLCYLTIGMALQATGGTCTAGYVDMLDTESSTFHYRYVSNSAQISGSYASCEAQPLGGAQATFESSISDPSVTSTGVITGSTGSGTEEPFDPLKASALFAFFFSFVVGVWVFAKNLGLILNAVRRW